MQKAFTGSVCAMHIVQKINKYHCFLKACPKRQWQNPESYPIVFFIDTAGKNQHHVEKNRAACISRDKAVKMSYQE